MQDGFDLYLHSFIVSDDGHWVVVQQGMNPLQKQARRYHWLSENLESFLDDPHAAIDGPSQGNIVNLADRRADGSRQAQVRMLEDFGPARIAQELGHLRVSSRAPLAQAPVQLDLLPHLSLPDHHDIRSSDLVLRRLQGNLAAAAHCGPRDFTELLSLPGVGARTMRALALVAEVLDGTPCRFSDPARFSMALGGKDRHPFPVPARVYDQTITMLKSAVHHAKLGKQERLDAIKRLDAQARRLETHANGPSFDSLMADERTQSASYGGRTVFGWESPRPPSEPEVHAEPAKSCAPHP